MTRAVSCRRPLLGCHLSIAKGLDAAIDEAEDLGNTALQIFTHSTSAWAMKPISAERAARFLTRRDASDVAFLAVHTMYLLNLASPKRALFERSIDGLREEIRRAAALGADAVVTHLGAHVGSGLDRGIERVSDALSRLRASDAFSRASGPRLLLENSAGSGTAVAGSLDDLAAVLGGLDGDPRFGVCLDSAHAFAFGYDLRTADDVDACWEALDRTVGADRVGLIHLNDSKYACGSRRDRHEHIGLGEIGRDGLGALARRACEEGIPVILETPKTFDGRKDADRMNLAAVRQLLEAPGDGQEEQ
jgi:deoxyribonuclease-4